MNETRCRYCKDTGYIMGMSHERWPCEECGGRGLGSAVKFLSASGVCKTHPVTAALLDAAMKHTLTLPYGVRVNMHQTADRGRPGQDNEPTPTPDAPEGWHEVGEDSWRCAELGVIWRWDKKGQALSTSLWSITDIPNVHVAALVAAEIDEAGGVSAVAMGPALFTVAWAGRWKGKGGGSFDSRLARFWGLCTETLSALGWAHDETPDLWWRPTP